MQVKFLAFLLCKKSMDIFVYCYIMKSIFSDDDIRLYIIKFDADNTNQIKIYKGCKSG